MNVGWIVFIIVILVVIRLLWSHEKNRAHEARLRALELSDIDNMNGLAFERYVARLLENEGFTNVEVTQGSGDYGVDITASDGPIRYAIQVKRSSSIVPRNAISDAVTGKLYYSCDAAMVITNSRLSSNSKEYAACVECSIIERDKLADWILKYQESGKQKAISSIKPKAKSYRKVTDYTNDKVPVNVFEKICDKAEQEFPDDNSMQEYVISSQIQSYLNSSQINAFRKIDEYTDDNIPSEIFEGICIKAEGEWAGKLDSQERIIKSEVEAYSFVAQYANNKIPHEILDRMKLVAKKEWPQDYIMQQSNLEELVTNYLKNRI